MKPGADERLRNEQEGGSSPSARRWAMTSGPCLIERLTVLGRTIEVKSRAVV